LPSVPNDAGIISLLAMALARSGVFGKLGVLERGRSLAERAVALAPSSGEAWLALGYATLYTGSITEAARAFARAVRSTPGHAMAQGMLGAMLLEAGDLPDALAHLDAAVSIDPANLQLTELARAYAYEGRFDEAIALLRNAPNPLFVEFLIGRLEMWRGRTYTFHVPATLLSPMQVEIAGISERCYSTGTITDADLAAGLRILEEPMPPRWRASQAQYLAEVLAGAGKYDDAIRAIRVSVDSTLYDALWFAQCPVLAPLRSRADFAELAAIVQVRADAILAAVTDALR
jgi:eukaryotic-like serine/threonine-protein kinase